jgi:hypothetical protein
VARALVTVAALVALIAVGLAWTWPPAPAPASAPAAEFSAARAKVHIDAIAQRPHPIGTAEHERVRAYVLEQLGAAKLAPEFQTSRSLLGGQAATVRNVIARLAGTGSGKAVVLMAHYDSRSTTPGASDDGYGVAALLETARALTTSAPLASDVIFLFTDGEEDGLLGAQAFVHEHRWAADVGVVLNFEARGNTGPVLMFQTGDDNGALLRELARAAPHPVASSLSQAIYRRMPNDTDLSIFLPRTPSLNFANIGGFERYHAPTDTPENADLGTLQHHGSYALSLARALGARTLPLPPEPNATYFNVGPFFVCYPGGFDAALGALTVGLIAAFVLIGRRRGAVRIVHATVGALATLLTAVASAIVCGLAWALAERLHRADDLLIYAARPAVKDLYLAALVAAALAVALAIQAVLLRRLRASEMFTGAAAVGTACGLALLYALPGGACLLLWPAAAATAVGLARIAGAKTVAGEAPASVAAAVAMAAPVVVLVAPLVPQIWIALGPVVAPAVGLVVALSTMQSAPAAQHVLGSRPHVAPAACAALAAATYLAANAMAPFSAAYPRPGVVVPPVND